MDTNLVAGTIVHLGTIGIPQGTWQLEYEARSKFMVLASALISWVLGIHSASLSSIFFIYTMEIKGYKPQAK